MLSEESPRTRCHHKQLSPLVLTPTDLAVTEETEVRKFMEEGCGCQLRLRGPYSAGFTIDSVLRRRMDAQELSWNDMDSALLGQIIHQL